MASPLTLCADDFGLSKAVNEAILDLAARGRLNATTLMVDGPEAASGVAALDRTGNVALGLHVVLSGEPTPLKSALAPAGRLPHVDALTARAFLGRLPLAAIEAEIERQYDRFEELAGRPPDFVDGHQHVHVLPRIRGLFLRIARRRAPGAWLRTCEDRLGAIRRRGVYRWKAARSAFLSRGLSAQAAGLGLGTNHGFAGLYDFRARRDYGRLFGRWLAAPGRAHLIICHPAAPDPADELGEARAREYAFLRDGEIEGLIAAAGLELAPFAPARG
jgi:chitin disaccharide deacetylase